jgi:hypothetical protein
MASISARSAYQSADTSSLTSFKTANDGSTASLNGGEGRDREVAFDWASARSFSTAGVKEVEEAQEVEEAE